MNTQDLINRYGGSAICQAASSRISGDPLALRVPGVTDFESLIEVFGTMSAAYATLSPLDQVLYAPALSELKQLALIEQTLMRRGLRR